MNVFFSFELFYIQNCDVAIRERSPLLNMIFELGLINFRKPAQLTDLVIRKSSSVAVFALYRRTQLVKSSCLREPCRVKNMCHILCKSGSTGWIWSSIFNQLLLWEVFNANQLAVNWGVLMIYHDHVLRKKIKKISANGSNRVAIESRALIFSCHVFWVKRLNEKKSKPNLKPVRTF